MTKAGAWFRLITIGACWPIMIVVLGLLLGDLAPDVLEQLVRWVHQADPDSLTRNQGILLAALVTASVGLWGAVSVKSRELRNKRADQLAEIALDCHSHIYGVHKVAEGRQELLEKQTAYEALIRRRFVDQDISSRTFASSNNETGITVAEAKRLEEMMDLHLTDWVAIQERTTERFQMYGTPVLATYVFRASNAVIDYLVQPTDLHKAEAKKLLSLMLKRSRQQVVALRRGPAWRTGFTLFIWASYFSRDLEAAWAVVRKR